MLDPELRAFLDQFKLSLIDGNVLNERIQHYLAGPNRNQSLTTNYMQPVGFFDPEAKRLLRPWFGNALKTVPVVNQAINSQIAGTATITVTAGQIWEIQQIYANALMDPTVIARQVNIVIMGHIPVNLVLNNIIAQTTGIALTQNEFGSIVMTAGFAPNLNTNDNGALAVVANENPLPLYLGGGATIDIASDNDQAGDLLEIEVSYRRVT